MIYVIGKTQDPFSCLLIYLSYYTGSPCSASLHGVVLLESGVKVDTLRTVCLQTC